MSERRPDASSRIVAAEALAAAGLWPPPPDATLAAALGGTRSRFLARVGLGPIAPDPPPAPAVPAAPVATRTDAEVEAAWRGGYERGLSDGLRAAEAARAEEADRFAQRFDAVLADAAARFAELEAALADDVMALALSIARRVVGEAVDDRFEAGGRRGGAWLRTIVEQALARLVENVSRPVVRLHPDDAAEVGDWLAPLLEARGARLQADPALSRGDCRIDAAQGGVDATLATRWARTVEAIGWAPGETPAPPPCARSRTTDSDDAGPGGGPGEHRAAQAA